MTRLFRRTAAVQIDDLRFVFPGFRIAFSVKQTVESEANSAQAQIWGLADTTRAALAELERPRFQIEAGYSETLASIFSGQAVEVSSVVEPPEVVTTAVAKDGLQNLATRMSKALRPGSKVLDAIREIASALGVDEEDAVAQAEQSLLERGRRVFSAGVTLFGSAQEEMDKLARSYGFDWSLQDGQLQLLSPEGALPDTSLEIGPDSGLIGSPARVRDELRPGRVLAKFRSLMRPDVRPGRLISLRSNAISGTFRTLAVEHAGDTASGQYQTSIEGVEL